jgi:urease accessory protein
MRRVVSVARRGNWPSERAEGTVTLAYDDRHRRRLQLASDRGEAFLLDLAEAAVLEEGDGLAFADGGWLLVKAAAEPLIEVRAADPAALARLAWHIGNRHLPAQIEAERILIREDHVIAAMLEQLGAQVSRVAAPFTPERGAYAGASPAHEHEHGDGHHGHS